jgi:DNA-binding transcriptional LysR family regulator
MMGSLDFVAASDWITIVPALMMNGDIKSGQYSVRPIIGPTATLDLVLIEPMRSILSPPAQAFLEILRSESIRLNDTWRRYFEPADHLATDRNEP